MGVHPIGAVLHLKAFEGQARHGRPLRPVSVMADVAPLMRLEAARREQRKWIRADPEDVENWGSVLIAFEEGTRAVVTVTDAGLGGLQEKVSLYLTNAVLHANPAQNTAVQAPTPPTAPSSRPISRPRRAAACQCSSSKCCGTQIRRLSFPLPLPGTLWVWERAPRGHPTVPLTLTALGHNYGDVFTGHCRSH